MGDKEAFCLLLWSYHGGEVSPKGLPVSTPGTRISGYCDNPDDCYRCPLMQRELARHPPGQANWVCPACLKEVVKAGKSKGVPVHLTGHYTEGQCQFVGCTRPPRVEYAAGSEEAVDDQLSQEWTKDDLVEKPRGYSRFLQLVIGDINT